MSRRQLFTLTFLHRTLTTPSHLLRPHSSRSLHILPPHPSSLRYSPLCRRCRCRRLLNSPLPPPPLDRSTILREIACQVSHNVCRKISCAVTTARNAVKDAFLVNGVMAYAAACGWFVLASMFGVYVYAVRDRLLRWEEVRRRREVEMERREREEAEAKRKRETASGGWSWAEWK